MIDPKSQFENQAFALDTTAERMKQAELQLQAESEAFAEKVIDFVKGFGIGIAISFAIYQMLPPFFFSL